MIELTAHGYERLKERTHMKGLQAKEYANKAYIKGKDIEECPKAMQKYLQNLLFNSKGDCIKVWSNQIFLFGHCKLITMFPIPAKIQHKITRIKNGRV